jgi:hypothetical protein
MYATAANAVIRKTMMDCMSSDVYHITEQIYDTDLSECRIAGIEETKSLQFCYKGPCTKHILANGGQEMIDEFYKPYYQESGDPDFEITLLINVEDFNLPKTQKLKKSMDDEQQEKIREQNEAIRAERKTIIEPIAELIARFKTYFISAPIRKAMNCAQ